MRNPWSEIFVMMVFGLAPGLYGQEAPPSVSPAASLTTTSQEKLVPSAPPSSGAVPPSNTIAAPYGEISGLVKSGNIPLPGVVVSAANTLTGKKYSTSTDVDGSFKIAVGGKGRYVVRAELSAFAPVTQEILLNDQNRSGM